MPNEQNPNQPNPDNRPLNPHARRNARRYALQAMYQWHLADTSLSDIETEFLHYHIDKNIDMPYFKELIHGIPSHLKEIELTMSPHVDRSLRDIDPVELAVLRVAIYELLKRPDVPYRVIINEALELTKKFGSVEGYKFVNGVLDRVAKQTRKVEIEMSKKNG